MSEITHDVWVEVDLSAMKHNLAQVRSVIPETTKIMAVVKGNGFGHGYVEPARAFVEAGADMLAVTRLEEALRIRQSGIAAPILLFAPILRENAEAAFEADLDLTVASLPLAEAISAVAQKLGKIARIWIEIDTGMGRLGLLPADALSFLTGVRDLAGIAVAGTYTHFAAAMEADLEPTRAQLSEFVKLIDSLRGQDNVCGLASAANSAALLRLPDSHLDIVRPGTLLYGQYPSQHVPHSLDLKPTWSLKARVCEVRILPKGSRIGYGSEFTARRVTTTAIVPIGFADGLTLAPDGPIYRQSVLKFAARKMKKRLTMEIRDNRAPVIGRVSMQMTVVDVTDIPGVQVGDVVTAPAMRIPTSPLIPRVYVQTDR